MSDAPRVTGSGPIKTLGVRLSEGDRALLDIIAQLNDRTVPDGIRLAIGAWIEKFNPALPSSNALSAPFFGEPTPHLHPFNFAHGKPGYQNYFGWHLFRESWN